MEYRYAIVDYRMTEKERKYLHGRGISTIDSFKNENVMESINGHVDISMYFDGVSMVIAKEAFNYYMSRLDLKYIENKGIKIYEGYSELNRKYPKDVSYNVCSTGKYIIGNFEFTDKKIKEIFEKDQRYKDLKKIEIKQGYANCSICQIDKNSIITADRGIYERIDKENIDALLIENGNIELFDMNYGFIGGASSVFEDKVLFFGDIDTHPDSEKIKKFIEKNSKKCVSMFDGKLKDFGSMFIF